MNHTPRILIIKLAALGDAVMASTMVPALRDRWPEAHITWLCGKSIAPLVELFDGIDRIATVNDSKLLTGSRPQRLLTLVAFLKSLAGQRFDLCLIAHKDWRYKLIHLSTFCGTVRAFNGRNSPIPGRWHGDEYRRLATGQNIPFSASAKLASLRKEALTHTTTPDVSNTVLLVPGGARNVMRDDGQRRWPVEHYRMLAKKLIAQGISVALAGGKNDLWTEESFAGLDIPSHIGKTSIPKLIAMLTKAKACVTHDTGPLHFAYLAGTPTVALFGPTLSSEKTPVTPKLRVLSTPSPCAPCYDGVNYAPCPDASCMRAISPDAVHQALCDLLEDEKFM